MGFIQGTSTPHRQAHDALTLINSTSRRFVIDGAMADDNADSEQSSDFDSDFEGWDDETIPHWDVLLRSWLQTLGHPAGRPETRPKSAALFRFV